MYPSTVLRTVIALSYCLIKSVYVLSYSLLYFLYHPSSWFRAAPVYPCLRAPELGEHSYVKTNGIKLHCVSSGRVGAPLLLLLHGFPELWYSWRYQIRSFRQQYRVVAVDLRGYGESDKPPQQDQYGVDLLAADITQLVSALGYDSCLLVGHDWGGAVAYQAALKRPDLFEKLIVLSCPLGRVYMEAARRDLATSLKPWYMILFQLPWIPERLLASNDYLILQTIMLSPQHGGLSNGNNLSHYDLQAYLHTYSQQGAFTYPINYYRRIFKKPKHTLVSTTNKIKVPTLVIFGCTDKFFSEQCKMGYEKYIDKVQVLTVEGSHWLQQDSPEEVNRIMRDFINIPEIELEC